MAIVAEKNLFTLHTDHSTYQMKADDLGYLLHLYYGERAEGSMEYLLHYGDRGFSGNPYDAGSDRTYSLDVLPQEYPVRGNGDFRMPALIVRRENGAVSADLRYAGYRILDGKYELSGLPAVYETEQDQDVQTLEVDLKDMETGLLVTLLYGVFPKKDVITRAVRLQNEGQELLTLESVQSASLDLIYGDYDWIQFYGRHAMERNVQRIPAAHGAHVIGSRRGTSSHQYNPFVILAEKETTEDFGSCYGMSFVYSGGFQAFAERDQYDQTRMGMGISPEGFSWSLKPGESFAAPEVILSYTGKGLGELSRQYHRILRHNVCRGMYKEVRRPILINNWEATYFDFNGNKIYEIAKQAAELGVEMLVLDDGWFGKRDSDDSGLGDWQVNEKKLGGTLGDLSERIHSLGMKFGLWIEPEMVSEDSDLYRAHPDWALAVPGKKPVRSRYQLVLDFSRKEVVDYIYGQISSLLDTVPIEYLKWDMNRSIADVYSNGAKPEEQGKVLHQYVLGLYDFLERLHRNYPQVLIEGCSGGGGRFDAGMLYYTPQIWCSDNTDAIDRVCIQYGTSFGYPVSAVGAHVSAVPNHQNGRTTPLKTRANLAMAGSFGYELDLNRLSEEEKRQISIYNQEFKELWPLIHNGDYYRLSNPFCMKQDQETAAWMHVSEDQREALVFAVLLNAHGNPSVPRVRLKGLKADRMYCSRETGTVYSGAALMSAGIVLSDLKQEYGSIRIHLTEVKQENGQSREGEIQ